MCWILAGCHQKHRLRCFWWGGAADTWEEHPVPAVLQTWQLVPITATAREGALAGSLGSPESGGVTESSTLCQGWGSL